MCFGRRDERVLLIDAQVRSQEGGWEVRDLIPYKETWLKGLGEYLSFETHRVTDVIWPSRLAGVECLPRVGEAVIPDLLGTNRMDELLKDVSRRYSLVLIDGPPVFPYVDADLLAKWSDGILLVVGSDKARLPAVKKAVARLQESGVPIVGVILNEVDPDYIDPALYGKDLDRSRLWPLDQIIPGLPRLFGRGKGKDEEE
jgi:Mrp family chromosome partitioning ATPase